MLTILKSLIINLFESFLPLSFCFGSITSFWETSFFPVRFLASSISFCPQFWDIIDLKAVYNIYTLTTPKCVSLAFYFFLSFRCLYAVSYSLLLSPKFFVRYLFCKYFFQSVIFWRTEVLILMRHKLYQYFYRSGF